MAIGHRRGLLVQFVRPGNRFLEIGSAPGFALKCAATLGAVASGLDYSATGVHETLALFIRVELEADTRCKYIFATTFADGPFDVVHSAGVSKHFDGSGEIVDLHRRLLRPGGVALITIPNLSGISGRISKWTDPNNLAIHSTNIMSLEALL